MIVSQLINGFFLGSLYVLFAMGLTLPFIVFRVPWFTHAALVMYGGFFTYISCVLWGLNFWLAMAIAAGCCALIAVVLERGVLHYLYDMPHAQLLVVIFGLYTVLQFTAIAAWGVESKSVSNFAPGMIILGGTRIPVSNLIVLVFGLVAIFMVHYFLKKTKLGKAIRATSQDYGTASILGINVNRVRTIVFLITGIFAGLAGAFLVSLFKVDPFMADYVIMKVFIVIVLGGFGSILGTIAGGYIVGMLESLIAGYISSQLRDPILFSIVILILLVRPTGLFAKEKRI